jgi:hypothetical protein
MKIKIFPNAFIISVIILQGCISEWDKMLDTDYLDCETVSSSENITDKTFDVDINSYKKNLNLNIQIKLPADFQFPLDSNGTNKMTKTSLLIAFYYKNNLISSSVSNLSEKHFKLFLSNPLILKTRDIDLSSPATIKLEIPMYIFHEIPKGEQEMEMYIYQEKLGRDYFYDDEGNYHEEEIVNTTIIEKRIKFTVEIPEIYETLIISEGFKLRNDSIFSPSGMDFSFGNGYPDIYWQLGYTVNDENIKNDILFISDMQKNATSFESADTVHIHHYGEIDKINIGIFDHDNVGRDEYIDGWEGELNNVPLKKQDFNEKFFFPNLEWFYIYSVNKGICN